MSAINERALRARHRDLLRRLGREIAQIRADTGRSQAIIARAAGISKAYQSMVEAGDAEPSIQVLERIGAALGADLGVRYFENTGPRIRDHLQVAMSEALLAALHPRWHPTPEVPVYRPVHGVIDLVLEDRDGPDTVATELQSQLRRLEQQIRWQTQKADALMALPHQQERRPSRLLVLRNTQAMRDLVRGAAGTLRASYPSRTADAVDALRGTRAWPGPAVAWMNVEGGQARLIDGPPRGVSVGR